MDNNLPPISNNGYTREYVEKYLESYLYKVVPKNICNDIEVLANKDKYKWKELIYIYWMIKYNKKISKKDITILVKGYNFYEYLSIPWIEVMYECGL